MFRFPRFQLRNVPFVEEVKYYEVEWNDEPLSIQDAIQRIQNGFFPESLVVFHPTYGTVNYDIWNDDSYSVARRGASVNGSRGGLARTFGNRTIGKEFLLEDINEIFNNVATKVNQVRSGKQKLLRAQTEAARKLMRNSGQEVPRNVEQGILEMIGEKKPVTSAFNVPNNQARIQTNLFTNEVVMPRHLKKINTTLFNGGKRRGKATRKQRSRTTRRRR